MPDEAPVQMPEPTVVSPVPGSGARLVPWRLVAVEPDGRGLRLEVSVGGPPCDVVTSVVVEESPARAVVTVTAGEREGARCGPGVPAVLAVVHVRAILRDPLGSRDLTDGALR